MFSLSHLLILVERFFYQLNLFSEFGRNDICFVIKKTKQAKIEDILIVLLFFNYEIYFINLITLAKLSPNIPVISSSGISGLFSFLASSLTVFNMLTSSIVL